MNDFPNLFKKIIVGGFKNVFLYRIYDIGSAHTSSERSPDDLAEIPLRYSKKYFIKVVSLKFCGDVDY
jgi:hypothetical protein